MGEPTNDDVRVCRVCRVRLVRTGSGGFWGNKEVKRGAPAPGHRVEIYRCPNCGRGYVYDPGEGVLDDL